MSQGNFMQNRNDSLTRNAAENANLKTRNDGLSTNNLYHSIKSVNINARLKTSSALSDSVEIQREGKSNKLLSEHSHYNMKKSMQTTNTFFNDQYMFDKRNPYLLKQNSSEENTSLPRQETMPNPRSKFFRLRESDTLSI